MTRLRKMLATLLATLTVLAMLAAPATPALAGGLTVRVVDQAGRPVANAVVVVRPIGRPAPTPRRVTGLTVDQRGLQFHPYVTLVPVGSSVSFPNFDKTRHHVYSFSSPKRFELKLFASEQSRSILFDKPGVVAVGCNIHDQMSAFLFVTDSAWSAMSRASGQVALNGLPAGRVSVTVFHPWNRVPGNVTTQPLVIGNVGGAATVTLKLRAPVAAMTHGY